MKRLQYILLACILIATVWYSLTHREVFLSLRRISLAFIILLCTLTFLSQIEVGYKFKILMKTFGVALGFQTWFGLSVCNAMFNYYLPARSGLAARAYYLKRRHQFGYSQYVSVTTGSTLAALPISAGTGLVTVPSIALTGGVLHWKLAILFGALLAVLSRFSKFRKWL